MNILVAGGAGYIGSHTCVALLEAGHDVIIVDSLVNSRIDNIQSIREIANSKIEFIEADVRDRNAVNKIFLNHQITAVINFAGHKSVNDSVNNPLDYYDNNLNCAMSLLECMSRHNVKQLVFSSSAAVYGEPVELPIMEDARLAPLNPYGRTKKFIEDILRDTSQADDSWKIAILRYFNPVGAHPSGLIGEWPNNIPNNLMPVIAKVATGELEKLSIFGGDYDSIDGTAIRDYIHVMDLARGHNHAIQGLGRLDQGEILTLNLGTGKGYSVLEILKSFEQACGREIPFEVVARRAGDVACCYADAGLASKEINWNSELGIDDMCKDAWNWQLQLDKLNRSR